MSHGQVKSGYLEMNSTFVVGIFCNWSRFCICSFFLFCYVVFFHVFVVISSKTTLFGMGLLGDAHGLGGKSVTNILQWWSLAQSYCTERRPKKYMNHVTHPLSSAEISIFHQKSANFAISRNTNIDCFSIFTFQFFQLFLSL